ncbi:hypothetical protein [Streptomyces flavofungini]|uniref:hypothetical protein n=1 Tax=Streptomyces flavofungini TaxID=68200 RepID=UPI0025B024E8|nr:hypothetical protein [Streptomyces flavofungini]WJV48578.1 hypothetical protein QUY26_25510 [Streptomyces flavofungini]
MTWWFKARRIWSVLVPCLVAFALVVAGFHGVAVEFPSLLVGGSNDFLLMLLAPVLVTSGLLLCLSSRLEEGEAVAWRPVSRYDTVLIVAAGAFAVAVGCAVGQSSGSDDAWSTGRNTLFLTGLMLLVHTVAPQGAVAVPVGWIFTVVFVGFDQFHRPYPWTVLPRSPSDLPAFTAALVAFTAGLVAHARHRPRP